MSGRTTAHDAPRLYGRSAELRALAALTDRSGAAGAALVVTSDPGLGRSALLDYAARSFAAGPVLHLRAALTEARLPYDGVRALHRAAAALRPAVSAAVAPAGPAADGPGQDGPGQDGPGPRAAGGVTPHRLVALLRSVAAEAPLLVCVDDAHLWDAPSRAALGLAGRLLHPADPVRLLVALPAHRAADPDFAALPALALAPLSHHAGAALLDDLTGGRVDPAVRAELLREAEGNPALLHALARRLSAAELSGGRPLPHPLVDAGTLTAVTHRTLARVPDTAAGLLLLAAAAHLPAEEDAGVDADLVFRAARHLGGPAAAAGSARLPDVLVTAGPRLRFTGPLLREALYASAHPDRRRAAHRALAAVLAEDGGGLAELLHRALSLAGRADRVADELAAAAADPLVPATHRQRSAACARAAELATDRRARAAHLTEAARHALYAGEPYRARRLIAEARAGAAPDAVRGRTEFVHGLMTSRDGPVLDACASLLLARNLLAAHDPNLAAAAGLAAAEAAWAAGDLAACLHTLGAEGGADPAIDTYHLGTAPAAPTAPGRPPAAAAAPPAAAVPGTAGAAVSAVARPVAPPVPASREDVLLRDYRLGMHALLEARLEAAAPHLRRVMRHSETADEPEGLLRSGAAALLLGDVPAACRIGARALAAVRARGPAVLEPKALEQLAYAELRDGRHARARAHAEEGLRTAHRYGQLNVAAHHHAVLALAASIVDDTTVVAHHAGAALATARSHGLGQAALLAQWAAGRADLARGRPAEAAARLGRPLRPGPRRGHFAVRMLAMPCYVEAAVLAGQPDDARAVVGEFALWAAFGADAQAPAQLARCRALLAPPEQAEELYERALVLHAEAGGDFEQARTQLLYGKWLRRHRKPGRAGAQLREALAAFEQCGARIWAEQAHAELRANGAAPAGPQSGGPRRPDDALERLTPQQRRIAEYVAEGATNREVALRLSVSTRTVDYHLRNVYTALGIRSRVELTRIVQRTERTAVR
ncbi:helix-turn-helix transcriptional regulator [Streptomyces minutiscleroticus]|uniref:Helix-turn-helix transcriptional regulator n=1 Tax=Streptomyces minutiscleroticus TaxID=68238 RepID=A0A918NRI7_9ACTN|nr:LuxR family transcriptional regulator [Streptomyces minutiscleroticus]GGX90039.1 helix-turn-helix transcriptional regulator [Streptomyces minutiscleroticus]